MSPLIRHHTIRGYGLVASADVERVSGGILYIKKQDYYNLEDIWHSKVHGQYSRLLRGMVQLH